MNIGIISSDRFVVKQIERELDSVVKKYIIQKYGTFNSYMNHRRNFEMDCLFIDVDLEGWLENSREIATDFKNVKIIFVGSNLEDSYKVYEVEHIAFVYKDRLDYLDNAIRSFLWAYKYNDEDYVRYSWKNTIYVQKARDIIYFERDKRKTIIHLVDGTERITYKHVDDFMEELDDSFIRVHNSFLLNSRYFKSYTREKVKMINDALIPISRKYSKDFRNRFLDCL
ncbi:LytR/AlgR family response regulator transcription factor [Floccifex sp.]|uniref:LytR/AlgR family response regulator transcription factor n=1 Tax=Floccifex sp. TaxID=2815810 RepID=UPI003F05FADB